MKPQEEAHKIFNRHYIEIFKIDSDYSEETLISILAKKHSIITVDEILKNGGLGTIMTEWYQEVKNEIEKL